MASSQGLSTAAYRAADEARRLEHGWIGPEHVLLALFAEPSVAVEALEEVGVIRERVEEEVRALGRSDPPRRGLSPGRGCRPVRPGTSSPAAPRGWPWPPGTGLPGRSTSCSR